MPNYGFFVTDAGVPATGLTPTWDALYRLSDNAAQAQPAISEVGNGWYKFDADIPYTEHWVGVIDCGATLANSERYVPIDMVHHDLEGRNKDVFAQPIYDEDTDSLTFVCCLLEDGKKSTVPTSVTLSIKNEAHVEQFALTSASFTSGVATLTKSTPGLTARDQYYVEASFTTPLGVITGIAGFVVLE